VVKIIAPCSQVAAPSETRQDRIRLVAGACLVPLALALDVGPAHAQTLVTNLLLPGDTHGLVLDSEQNRIYTWTGRQGAQTVLAVDGDTFQQANWGVGQGVSVDLATHRVWAASLYSGFALAYAPEVGARGLALPAEAAVQDSSTRPALTPPARLEGLVSLGFCPGSVAVDTSNRIAWVEAQCGTGSDPVWAIDADSFSVRAGPFRSGGINGEPSTVNPATGRYYFCSGGKPKRLDPTARSVVPTAFGAVIGVNPEANLLYARGDGPWLRIVAGSPDPEVVLRNVSLPFPAPGSRIGVDTVRTRIYVQNMSGNQIVQMDGATGAFLKTLTLVQTGDRVQSLAVDSGRNLLYALAATEDSRGRLYVIRLKNLCVIVGRRFPSKE
jgi:DNA-binding beta-propeller fold protein YncE